MGLLNIALLVPTAAMLECRQRSARCRRSGPAQQRAEGTTEAARQKSPVSTSRPARERVQVEQIASQAKADANE
jgi:hypothetical protein